MHSSDVVTFESKPWKGSPGLAVFSSNSLEASIIYSTPSPSTPPKLCSSADGPVTISHVVCILPALHLCSRISYPGKPIGTSPLVKSLPILPPYKIYHGILFWICLHPLYTSISRIRTVSQTFPGHSMRGAFPILSLQMSAKC